MSLPIPAPVADMPAGVPRLPRDVCPHCKRPLTVHGFATGGYINRTYHCRIHGDVPPMRSVIWTEY